MIEAMEAIIDTNVVSKVLLPDRDPAFEPVRKKLLCGEMKLAYGGRLRREYVRINRIRSALKRLDQNGFAILYPDGEVDKEARRVRTTCDCKSNDHHVLALARISGARLLCTLDRALTEDFTDKSLVDKPRGRVYKRASKSHIRLLEEYSQLCRR